MCISFVEEVSIAQLVMKLEMTVITHYCIFFRAGGKSGAVRSCSSCNGRGVKVTIRHIGPGMVQQMQSACNVCRGEGM